MDALRTPDERFADLPGYAFAPHYVDDLAGFAGLRLHYLDEGPQDGPVALCLHGQPTWSYLYRRMIPGLVDAGFRVLAPDLFGFGRSDKPGDDAVYTFDFHRKSLLAFARFHALHDALLVCQDWGGLLGLTLPVDLPHVFDRLLVMNTTLATGTVPLGPGFLAWRDFNNRSPDMNIAALMQRAVPGLTDAEAAAYAAPFPDSGYKAGVRRFPNLVADSPQAPGAAIARRAAAWWENEWTGQTAMVVGMQDPVLGAPVMAMLRATIRNCPAPLELADAGHFTQEAGSVITDYARARFGL